MYRNCVYDNVRLLNVVLLYDCVYCLTIYMLTSCDEYLNKISASCRKTCVHSLVLGHKEVKRQPCHVGRQTLRSIPLPNRRHRCRVSSDQEVGSCPEWLVVSLAGNAVHVEGVLYRRASLTRWWRQGPSSSLSKQVHDSVVEDPLIEEGMF